MNRLWDNFPELRAAVYEGDIHMGENVLHIAIVRKLSDETIRKFVSSQAGKVMLGQRATGPPSPCPSSSSHHSVYLLSENTDRRVCVWDVRAGLAQDTFSKIRI